MPEICDDTLLLPVGNYWFTLSFSDCDSCNYNYK